MLMPLYSICLGAALLLSSPWWLFRMLTTERYREGLRERLGRVPAEVRTAACGKRTVWLHAVSVGEVLAASSLVTGLEQELGPGWQVVVSTTTRTGQQLARKRFGSGRVFYFPLDFGFAVRAWLDALRPELLLLTESELWPRMLHECARRGIPVAVVNARISDRSLRRTLRFRGLWRLMARHVTVWLAQSDEDAARILRLGVAGARVHTTGNLKYDTARPEETPLVTAIRTGAAGRPVLVAGSTVAHGDTNEEAILLEALRSHVWPAHPDALLVLAPRHPERFAEAASPATGRAGNQAAGLATRLAAEFGPTLRATDLLRAAANQPTQARILLLDTIGDLAAVYRLANVAFVGGSLVPHGGHNPLEPAQFGVPVVTGPHTGNFRDMVSRMSDAGGLLVLPSGDPDSLGRAFAALLADPARAQALGEHGRAVCEQQKGATARTVSALLPLLQTKTGAPRATEPQTAFRGRAGGPHVRRAPEGEEALR